MPQQKYVDATVFMMTCVADPLQRQPHSDLLGESEWWVADVKVMMSACDSSNGHLFWCMAGGERATTPHAWSASVTWPRTDLHLTLLGPSPGPTTWLARAQCEHCGTTDGPPDGDSQKLLLTTSYNHSLPRDLPYHICHDSQWLWPAGPEQHIHCPHGKQPNSPIIYWPAEVVLLPVVKFVTSKAA